MSSTGKAILDRFHEALERLRERATDLARVSRLLGQTGTEWRGLQPMMGDVTGQHPAVGD